MAISDANGCREILVEGLGRSGKPLPNLTICELGNQRFKTAPGSGMRRLQSAGSVLRFLGAQYTSIDWNGNDGALPHDLGQPLPKELHEQYDIVTNFGTSEHVQQGQRTCFENIHRLCKPGGLMLHCVPASGTCAGHGHWKYSEQFFRELAQTNGYDIVRLDTYDKSQGYPDKEPGSELYVRAILRKRGSSTKMPVRWARPSRE